MSDRESDYEWECDGEPVVRAIANAAEIPEQAAQDIQAILDDKYGDFDAAAMGEETEFCSGSYYEEKGPSDHMWQEEWRYFDRSLKTEARFFSRSAGRIWRRSSAESTRCPRPTEDHWSSTPDRRRR